MKPIRFALSAIARFVARPAFAVTTTTFNFTSSAVSATNVSPSNAYMGIGGPPTGGAVGTGNDDFKVNGLTASIMPSRVPEPGPRALFGIAGGALSIGRHRRARES